MTNLPQSSKYVSQAFLTVSEDERDLVVKKLNDAFTAGGLDTYEYQHLLDVAYEAKTLGELAPVVEKLPVGFISDEPEIVRQNSSLPPGELSKPAPGMLSMTQKFLFSLVGLSILAVVLIVLLGLL